MLIEPDDPTVAGPLDRRFLAVGGSSIGITGYDSGGSLGESRRRRKFPVKSIHGTITSGVFPLAGPGRSCRTSGQ